MANSVGQVKSESNRAETLVAAIGPSQRPDPATVVEALLGLEKTAKHDRVHYSVESLLGDWRLWFVTGAKKRKSGGISLGKGFYVPQFAPAQISFQRSPDGSLTIANQVQLGNLRLRLTGPAKYLGKKNLLAFDFTQWQLVWGTTPLFQQAMRGGAEKQAAFEPMSIAKLPFFAFFHVTEDLIAARGRGGGLAIWLRQSVSRL